MYKARILGLELALKEAKRRLEAFRDAVVKEDMIVPLWVGQLLDEITIVLPEETT